MLAVVVAFSAIVALSSLLVLGLLRSHADIIRALHSLGVGVGDPADGHAGHQPVGPQPVDLTRPAAPPLPAERGNGVHDIEGIDPAGGQVAVAAASAPSTLLIFLTTGCQSCAAIWGALGDPAQRAAIPATTRVVAVTKGTEWESPGAVAAKRPIDTTVVMSTDAWGHYEVPGSPYFILVDGARGVRVGEGVGQSLAQIAGMISRADVDEADLAAHASRSQAAGLGLDGPEREAYNDAVLQRHGIGPGHPSLYPRDLGDVFASTAPVPPAPAAPEE